MDKCYEAGERKITELDSLEQVKEMASDKKEEVALLETKLKRAEEELECKKEVILSSENTYTRLSYFDEINHFDYLNLILSRYWHFHS